MELHEARPETFRRVGSSPCAQRAMVASRPMSKSSPLSEIGRFLGWLVLPLAVGGVSGFITAGSVETWYATIEKPAFNPPDWIFGPTWTVLYLLMGLAAYLAFRHQRAGGADPSAIRAAKIAFFVQLALNGLWSIIFFGLHQPGFALLEILILWVAIGATVRAFTRLSKPAAGLLLPYWAWVSFATVLNASIWWLNR